MPLSFSRDSGPEVRSLQTSASVSQPELCPWQWQDGQVSAWVLPSSHERLWGGKFLRLGPLSPVQAATSGTRPPAGDRRPAVRVGDSSLRQPLSLDEITQGSGCSPSLRLQTQNGGQQHHARGAVGGTGRVGLVGAGGLAEGQALQSQPREGQCIARSSITPAPLYPTYWENSHPDHLPRALPAEDGPSNC